MDETFEIGEAYYLEELLSTVKLEPILTTEGEIFGYEMLLGDSVVFNKEEFFNRIDETLDFIILETHLEVVNRVNHLREIPVFINILPQTMFRLVEKVNFPENVVFEIRENLLSVDDMERIRKIKEEKKLVISLDDFGRGGSNFERFFLLKPDYVKLDMLLFKKLHYSCKRAILSRINAIFGSVGSEIIAEKIETQEDLDLIVSSNIKLWQGVFSREVLKF